MLVGEMRFAENPRESAGCRYRNENLLAAVALTGYVHRALDRTALNMARLKCFDSLATTVYILGGIPHADVHDIHPMRSLRHLRSKPPMVCALPETEGSQAT